MGASTSQGALIRLAIAGITVVALTAAGCASGTSHESEGSASAGAYRPPCIDGVNDALAMQGTESATQLRLIGTMPADDIRLHTAQLAVENDFRHAPDDLKKLGNDFNRMFDSQIGFSVGASQRVLGQIVRLCEKRGVKFPSKVPCSDLSKQVTGSYKIESVNADYLDGKPTIYWPNVTIRNRSTGPLEVFILGLLAAKANADDAKGFGAAPDPEHQEFSSSARDAVQPGATFEAELGGEGILSVSVYPTQKLEKPIMVAQVREVGRVVPCGIQLSMG